MIQSAQVKTEGAGAPVVAQWLRVQLAMQGTLAQSPVQEDPPRLGGQQLGLCGTSPRGAATDTRVPQSPRSATREACILQSESGLHSLQLERARAQQQRPRQPRDKYSYERF